jgi:hypothetical protein
MFAFKRIGLISFCFCLLLGCKNHTQQIAQKLVDRATQGQGYEDISIYKDEDCFAKSRALLGLGVSDTRDFLLEKGKNYQYQSRVWLDSFEALGWKGKRVSALNFRKVECPTQKDGMQCFQFQVGDQRKSLDADLVLLEIDGQLVVQYLHWNLDIFHQIIKPLIDSKPIR